MKGPSFALVLLSFLSTLVFAQQPSSDAPQKTSDASQKNVMVIGELAHAIDVKKAKVGDQITLRLTYNVGIDGRVVVPRNKGKVIGHISQVQPPTKDNPQSLVAIEFDRVEVKGGNDLPITATILSMTPPDHRMIRQSPSIPTSGDDPAARANPAVDSRGQPIPPHVPLTEPGPRVAASNDRFSAGEGLELARNPATHTTVVSSSKKSLWIEDGTRITLVAQSPAL